MLNQINVEGRGDILLVFTDGLSDHCKGEDANALFVQSDLENILIKNKDSSAKEIAAAIKQGIKDYCPVQNDDIT